MTILRKILMTLFVWVMCFIAITSSAVLVYQWYKNRGTMISISFEDASGLVPKQSKILYLGVQVGTIQDIIMDTSTNAPLITARIANDLAKELGPESMFWIVKPEFSLGNIANLSTILTGDYIAVQPMPGKSTVKFVGQEEPPLDQIVSNDLKIQLYTTNATGLNIGSPILFRGVEIGKIAELSVGKNLQFANIIAHIEDEYKYVIRKASVFANISGFHASIQLFGSSKISMDSFETLLSGGINVYNFNANSPQAGDGDKFKLYTTEQFEAMQNS